MIFFHNAATLAFLFFQYLIKEGGCHTEEIRNLEGKRVCDISLDRTVIEIVQKGCLTRITANPDGTLNVENIRLTQVA